MSRKKCSHQPYYRDQFWYCQTSHSENYIDPIKPVRLTNASRVKIPFVGDDTTDMLATTSTSVINIPPVLNPLRRHQDGVCRSFIDNASHGIRFAADVIDERGAQTLPYNADRLRRVYDPSGVVGAEPKQVAYSGRFNSRGYRKKVPSHIRKLVEPDSAAFRQKDKVVTERWWWRTDGDGAYATASVDSSIDKKPPETTSKQREQWKLAARRLKSARAWHKSPASSHQRKSVQWDEYLISQLSKDTARWIVYQNTDAGGQKNRLDCLVRDKFGVDVSSTNLVPEEAHDFAVDELRKEKERKENEQKAKLEARQQHLNEIKSDPKLGQTFSAYYKLPRHLKEKQLREPLIEREVNQTVQNLNVKHIQPPPPTRMEDFLNPAAGKYIIDTKNAFEQQLYSNQAKPVYRRDGDKSRIIMDDLSEYQSKVEKVYPPDPADWLDPSEPMSKKGKVSKGARRWVALPEPADFASERGLNPPRLQKNPIVEFDLSQSADLITNKPLVRAIEDWRSKWKLASGWQEVTLADIMIDLDSIHDHVRLGALAACSVAALHNMPVPDVAILASIPRMETSSPDPGQGHLPEPLRAKVELALHDSSARCQLAAALCLYALGCHDDAVTDVLEHHLRTGLPSDRIACAQCLALHGNSASKIVYLMMELLLLDGEDRDQATDLLVHLSKYTRIVHCLLAERLNSSNWKVKVVVCNTLALLHGNINRDLVHKLTHLMWHDWSSEVRKAASRALGMTGHGRDVHYELRDKLISGNDRVVVEVLKKIGHLGIMTATLLFDFVKCFSSDYVSVRLESCHTAAKLRIAEPRVVHELVRLARYEHAWKIKAYAIKALGEIGQSSEEIASAILWALRFEDEPGVRLEACVTLRKLRCDTAEVVHVLQDRVLVEPDPDVKEEVRATLTSFGLSGPDDNMEMIQQIKKEVRKLCRKSVVAAKVIMYERELDKFEREAHYVGDMLDNVTDSCQSAADSEIMHALNRSPSSRPGTSQQQERGRNTAFAISPHLLPSSPRPVKTSRVKTPSSAGSSRAVHVISPLARTTTPSPANDGADDQPPKSRSSAMLETIPEASDRRPATIQ